MLATSSGGTPREIVRAALSQLQQSKQRYDHIILAAAEGSIHRSAPLQIEEIAAGGLDALRLKLRGRQTGFAILRVSDRLLLIVSLGRDLPWLMRAKALVQGRALHSTLGAGIFAAVTIASPSQLTTALVGSKLQLDGFARVPSPSLDQDFRSSWEISSRLSIASRAKPSAPSSPDDVSQDAGWSRWSDFGPFGSPSMLSSRMNRTHHLSMISRSPDNGTALLSKRGIIVDFALVTDSPKVDTTSTCTRSTPRIQPRPLDLRTWPASPEAIESDDADGSYSSESDTPHASTTSFPPNLGKPFEPSQSIRVARPGSSQSRKPSGSPSIHVLGCLPAESERVRVDEAIRGEVMRKLRAEQQAMVTPKKGASALRTRSGISSPLGPPPPFAPPPVPHSTTARSIGRAEPDCCLRKSEVEVPSDTKRSSMLITATWASEPHSASVTVSIGDCTDDAHDRESCGSCLRSTSLCESVRKVGKGTSLAKPPGIEPSWNSGSMDRMRGRGRQPSESEGSAASAVSTEGDGDHCDTSGSTTSLVASSIFDKELPVPPPEDCTDDACGQEQAAEAAEVKDLRDRLVHAEARARVAEEATQIAVRKVRSEMQRLAMELANMERSNRDRLEAEALRRAKWAREQAARNQLDAYERSKLEAGEKRRRRVLQGQRQREVDKASRIREEQEWRDREAVCVKAEYEVKIERLAQREAKLKTEAAAQGTLQRERREQEDLASQLRLKRIAAIQKAVHSENERQPITSGWLNYQDRESLQWKRRWYKVGKKQLVLFQSANDSARSKAISLEPTHLISVHDDHEDPSMSHTIRTVAQHDSGTVEERTNRTILVSLDSHAA